MKLKFTALLLLLTSAKIFSQWNHDPSVNTVVSSVVNNQQDARIVSDAKSGAIISWVDFRNNLSSGDIFVQRMNALGFPLWTANGVPVCTDTANQAAVTLANSTLQSAILTWQDWRSGDRDIYAQKVDSLGNVLWTTNGVAVAVKVYHQQNPKIIADQAGGAIIVWEDSSAGSWDIYAQHLNSAGVATWTAGGVVICSAVDDQKNPRIISDNANGAIVSWQDRRDGIQYNIFAQRINPSGAVQWTADGVQVCNIGGGETNPKMEMDGSGGAYIAWQDKRSGIDYDIYAQRLNSSGALQWSSNGIAVSNTVGSQTGIDMTADMVNGLILSWKDNRTGLYQIYTNMLSPTGTVLWTTNGVLVAPGINPNISGDMFGGAVIAWQDSTTAGGTWNVYSQRFNASGVKQWTTSGVPIAIANGGQSSVKSVSTANGGTIYCWQDKRSTLDLDIYAHSVTSMGVAAGINFIESIHHSDVACFPNPFSSSTKLCISSANEITLKPVVWEVFDCTGKMVFTKTTENENQLELDGSTWSNGVYFYHVSTSLQLLGNGSFVIQH